MSTKQVTLNVEGKKILIKSRQKTRMGNFMGFNVNINGIDFHCHTLYRIVAIESAYARWVKNYT